MRTPKHSSITRYIASGWLSLKTKETRISARNCSLRDCPEDALEILISIEF